MKTVKLALVDNDDSFTYNLVDLLRRFDGVRVKVLRSETLNLARLADFGKIIISPGPGLPRDYPILFDLLDRFHASRPILGVCLGHQAMGCHFGASLVHLRPVVHGEAQGINRLGECPIFRNLPWSFDAGLYHSWAIAADGFPTELEITAVSRKNVVMSISHRALPVFGVQFHPESHMTPLGSRIVRNFIELT